MSIFACGINVKEHFDVVEYKFYKIYMMSKFNSKVRSILFVLLFIFVIYCVSAFTIMRFSHPEYTETELLLSFTKAFLLDFR